MNRERFEELSAAYSLGSLSKAEQEELRIALEQGGEEYAKILASFVDAAQHLALAVDDAEPSPAVKEAVMKAISEKTKSANTSIVKGSDIFNWLEVAAMLVVCFFAGLLYYNNTQLNEQVVVLEETVEQQRFELLDLKNQLASAEQYLDVISSRNTRLVSMGGLEPSPSAFGRLFLDESTSNAVLQIAELPATPDDKDYQLWIIRDGEPVSAGLFSLDRDRENYYLSIENFVEQDLSLIAAVAITIEPKGGMPQPTGDMFLIGTP